MLTIRHVYDIPHVSTTNIVMNNNKRPSQTRLIHAMQAMATEQVSLSFPHPRFILTNIYSHLLRYFAMRH